AVAMSDPTNQGFTVYLHYSRDDEQSMERLRAVQQVLSNANFVLKSPTDDNLGKRVAVGYKGGSGDLAASPQRAAADRIALILGSLPRMSASALTVEPQGDIPSANLIAVWL